MTDYEKIVAGLRGFVFRQGEIAGGVKWVDFKYNNLVTLYTFYDNGDLRSVQYRRDGNRSEYDYIPNNYH